MAVPKKKYLTQKLEKIFYQKKINLVYMLNVILAKILLNYIVCVFIAFQKVY